MIQTRYISKQSSYRSKECFPAWTVDRHMWPWRPNTALKWYWFTSSWFLRAIYCTELICESIYHCHCHIRKMLSSYLNRKYGAISHVPNAVNFDLHCSLICHTQLWLTSGRDGTVQLSDNPTCWRCHLKWPLVKTTPNSPRQLPVPQSQPQFQLKSN